MKENPRCLFNNQKLCSQECSLHDMALQKEEIDRAVELRKLNQLRILDKVNIKPSRLPVRDSKEDYVVFYGLKPKDCLCYQREVLEG